MLKTFSLLLVFALALAIAPVRAAQNAASQLEIIDVLPSVDDINFNRPSAPFFSCDFMIGAQNRPVWWGQSFEDRFSSRQTVSARMQIRNGPVSQNVAGLGASIVLVRWNEPLGLYFYHAQFYWPDKKWVRDATYSIEGTLPALLPGSETLSFALQFESPSKGEFAVAEMTAPQPKLWVRSIRIAPRLTYIKDDRAENFPYEIRISVASRRVQKRSIVLNMPEFFDATGSEMRGGYGLMDGAAFPGYSFNQLPLSDPVEFVTLRIGFNQQMFESTSDLSVRRKLELNGRAPLTVAFPVIRDGKLLTGEVAPRDWTIAPQ